MIDCDAQSSSNGFLWLFETLLPSLPPTITAIVGFYIFHRLAIVRQKREEIRQLCEKFKETITDLAGTACECWSKEGEAAVKSGDVMLYKGKIIIVDNNLSTLMLYNKVFESVRGDYLKFKRLIDERVLPDKRVSIESAQRSSDSGYGFRVRVEASKVHSCVDRIFSKTYR